MYWCRIVVDGVYWGGQWYTLLAESSEEAARMAYAKIVNSFFPADPFESVFALGVEVRGEPDTPGTYVPIQGDLNEVPSWASDLQQSFL